MTALCALFAGYLPLNFFLLSVYKIIDKPTAEEKISENKENFVQITLDSEPSRDTYSTISFQF